MAEGICEPVIAPSWGTRWKPRDRRPIYEWARENVYLPPRLTRSGWFNVDHSRQFIGPFDALQNHRVREVNVCAPVRDGKTLIADVWLAWLLMNAPGPFRWVFADDQQARDQSEERVKPILLAMPDLARFVPRGEISDIAGVPVAIDGPAMGNLQARGYEKMTLDEPWMWASGRLFEAKERQKDFRKRGSNKLLCISQGGAEKCEDWKDQFHLGVIHEWQIQCQGCGKYMEPVWNGRRDDKSFWGMKWDKFKEPNGHWNAPKSASTARFECFYCGHAHVDTPLLKQRWNLTGKYVAETCEKNDQKVSFHWNAIPTYLFADLVELYLNAINQRKNGSSKALLTFHHKQLADFATEQTLMGADRNFKIVQEIKSDWQDEEGRLMTVDWQIGGVRIVTVRQWSGKARETRRLYRGIVQGEDALVEVQERFKVPPNHVLVDSGDDAKYAGGVYATCIRHGWIATKGVGTILGNTIPEGFKHDLGNGLSVLRSYSEPAPGDPETGNEQRAILIKFATDCIADLLDGLIASGFWVEPEDDGSAEEKDYRQQMAAEFKKAKIDKFSGREVMRRVCPSKRNHYYDCAKLQVLGAILMDWLPDPMDNRTVAEKR